MCKVKENFWSLAPGGTPTRTLYPSRLWPKNISPFGFATYNWKIYYSNLNHCTLWSLKKSVKGKLSSQLYQVQYIQYIYFYISHIIWQPLNLKKLLHNIKKCPLSYNITSNLNNFTWFRQSSSLIYMSLIYLSLHF